jgi:hypothetical protein
MQESRRDDASDAPRPNAAGPPDALLRILVGAALAAVALSVWAFWSQDGTGRDKVLQELAKVTWQFLLVGVLGGFVTYVLQQRRAREVEAREMEQQREVARSAMDAFRAEMLRRTVTLTNAVRRVPLLVSARRSFRTYDEQMRAVIDAYLDLRAMRHEIENLGSNPNAAFGAWPQMRDHMRAMEAYLASLCEEFAGKQSKEISELQIEAEEQRARQGEVWERLRTLPVLGDMLQELPDSGPTKPEPTETKYYDKYMRPYGEVIRLMRAELMAPSSGTGLSAVEDGDRDGAVETD